MLETEEIRQRFVAPLFEKRVADQGRPCRARQIGPVTFRAVVVEVLFPALCLFRGVLARSVGSVCAAGGCDRRTGDRHPGNTKA
jgi:hypothetical protein